MGVQGILPIQWHRNLTECVCVCVMEKDVQSMHGTLQWNVSGTVVRACVGNVEAHMLQWLH